MRAIVLTVWSAVLGAGGCQAAGNRTRPAALCHDCALRCVACPEPADLFRGHGRQGCDGPALPPAACAKGPKIACSELPCGVGRSRSNRRRPTTVRRPRRRGGANHQP